MTATRRLLNALVAVVATSAALFAGFVPVAGAQTTVTGTADFRNAPQLPPGEYSDRIVSGDSAWYALVYTNGTEYEFEVSILGDAPSELNISASFVAPTLDVVDGPNSLVTGNGATYPDGHTNVWFLKVTLETTGQTGIEYPVTIRVDGVRSEGRTPCNQVAGCSLDDDYADIVATRAEAQAALDNFLSLETTESVQAQIDNAMGLRETAKALGPRADARLAEAEAQMAELCAPDAVCGTFPEPSGKTPLIGWIAGMAVLGFGAFRAAKKLQADDPDDGEFASHKTPASLAKARSAKN